MTKQTFLFIGFALLLVICPQAGFAQNQVVIYQDTFDGDGLVSNNSIGGGLNSEIGLYTADAGSVEGSTGFPVFADAGKLSLTGPANGPLGGRMVAMAFTQNAFSVPGGFELEVVFDITSLDDDGDRTTAPFPSNSFSFGLLDQASNAIDLEALFTTNESSPVFPRSFSDGIGLNLTRRTGNSAQGLIQSDGALENETVLSTAQVISTGTFQTFNLSVDQLGNFSYQVNGATPTTGFTNLDLSNDYHFVAYIQGSNGESLIRSVTLTTTAVSETLLGDCNLDGVVDFLDISPFVAILSAGDYVGQADINEDGEVDFFDISPFIELQSL